MNIRALHTLVGRAELGPYLDRFRIRLFRMETLPAYAVTSDGDDYTRWLAGESEPTWDRKTRWMDALRRERSEGRVSSRVRILSTDITEYERYSCEWGYLLNAEAGEDIRVLRRGEHSIPDSVIDGRDWWLIDDDDAVAMHYDKSGVFVGGKILEPFDVAALVIERHAAWAAAEPFLQWWDRHPELHRQVSA